MHSFKTSNERLTNGDHLNDDELRMLEEGYDTMESYLFEMGSEFHLARVEVSRRLNRVREYLYARSIR